MKRLYISPGGMDSQVAMVVRGEGENDWRTLWILRDQVHSVMALYDVDSEELVESYEYDPLGRPRFFGAEDDGCPETTGTAPDIGNRMLFTGREYEPDAGADLALYHVRHRVYAAGLGRFISRDPIGLAGGQNVYAWAGDDPVNFRDPTGLWEQAIKNPFHPEMGGGGAPVAPQDPIDTPYGLIIGALIPVDPGEVPPEFPKPPGYGDGTGWEPHLSPDAPPGKRYEFFDPDGNRWSPHPEDKAHNDHWDVRRPGAKKWINIPCDPDTPIFKRSSDCIEYIPGPGEIINSMENPLILIPLVPIIIITPFPDEIVIAPYLPVFI